MGWDKIQGIKIAKSASVTCELAGMGISRSVGVVHRYKDFRNAGFVVSVEPDKLGIDGVHLRDLARGVKHHAQGLLVVGCLVAHFVEPGGAVCK